MSNTYGSTWKNSYGKTHYENNKSYYIERAKKTQKRIRRFVHLIKVMNPFCVDCNIKYPFYVLDFDHRRGEKRFVLSKVYTTGINKVKEELRKCDIVCANCHRIRTFSK